MIQPNKYQQAVQELQTYSLNDFELPESMPAKGMDKHYLCVGVNSKDSIDGMSKVHKAKVLQANIKQWHTMKRQIKQGMFKREFGDIYQKIIILHDPFIKPKAEVKDLSPKQKGSVKKLIKEEVQLSEIAKALEIDLKRVEAYAKTL